MDVAPASIKVSVLASDGTPDIVPMGDANSRLEEAVDADIAKFDEYFQRELKNDPLIASEKAILKTYLWHKTHVPEVQESQNVDDTSK